jgi:hypothetical protein
VDNTGALESIAGLLPSLPDESVEGLLLTYDSLVNVSNRPAATEILRRMAAQCEVSARRDRLIRAAEAVGAGQTSASQNASTYSMTGDEWERHIAEHPLPPPPAPPEDNFEDFDEEDEQEDPENSPYMAEEPPKLPDLPVRFFFPGLVVRVARDFSDAYGRAVSSSDLLRVINSFQSGSEYAIACMDRNIRVSDKQAEIIANAGNSWFQPVPSTNCLEELLVAIERSLGDAEEDEEVDLDRVERLRDEIDKCEAWIAEAAPRSAAPKCRHGQLPARLFGPDHELAYWIRLLFAAVGSGGDKKEGCQSTGEPS